MPWGLRPATWALWLALITWLGSLTAIVRRREPVTTQLSILRRLRPGWGLSLGAAIFLAAGSLALAVAGSAQPYSEPFTRLWLLPDTENRAPAVRLGVLNMENTDMTYRLVLTADDVVLYESLNIELMPGEGAESTVTLPEESVGAEIRAELYRAEAPQEVYRRVHLGRHVESERP